MRISDWSSDVCSSDLLGHIQVEGDGLFLGDVSATINVNADQIVSATGSLTVQASGAGGTAGTAAVNVNGGTFGALGNVSIIGDSALDAATGDATGGSASLSITGGGRSEEHTSELQSLLRISYAVFCLKKKNRLKTAT